MRPITQYITIDDVAINRGDPYEIIDPVWWTANIYAGELEYLKSLALFSREQRLIFAVIWYAAEVNNGGHHQFYFNSTGIVWKDAITGFEDLGISEGSEIIAESASRLGGQPSLDHATRRQQLDHYQPDFSDLDTQFYDLEKGISLDEVMQYYIFQHRSAFYFEGEVRKLVPND